MAGEQGLSRRTSRLNGSTSSLTRRRSLVQTPGVATRISPVEGRRKTWNSWKPPVLAPEEAAKWTPSPPSRTPARPLVAVNLAQGKNMSPIARTPGETEYTHLGSLKLGTLSIVNGAPSPAASAKFVKSKSRAEMEEDYFSTAEGSSSPLTMKSARKRGHVKSKSAVLPATGTFYGDESIQKALPRLPPIATTQAKYVSAQQEYATASNQITVHRVELPSHDAGVYAKDYRAELPASPFKPNSGYCHIHEDEGIVADSIDPPQDQTAQALTATAFDAPTTATEAFGSTLFPITTATTDRRMQNTKGSSRPQPRTVDSGYSSGGSLRKPNTPEEAPAHVPMPVDSHPRRPGAQGPIAYPESHQQNRPPSLVVPNHSSRSSISESLVSPQTPRSVTSRTSFDSTNSSRNPRRLQRRRSSQLEAPIVQSCQPIPEGNIPDVPENIRAKFTRRLSHTPGMECLTHTFPSKDHVLTADNNASTTAAPSTVVTGLAELDSEPPTPPPHGLRKSLSRFRRKSMTGEKDMETGVDASFGVVDLGTIASSLGSSPYDIAMPEMSHKSSLIPTHPHQLGGTLPRAKSMVGMGSEMAAEYARAHSRDRALVERERHQQRRKSHHNLKADVGEMHASKRRPQSSTYDVPPVPTIDTAKLKAPHSAKPRLEGESAMLATSALDYRQQFPSHGKSASQIVSKHEYEAQNNSQHDASWDAHARMWSQRRKSIGEGLRDNARLNETPAVTTNSRNSLQSMGTAAAWGRYSGGLDYNYEHGVGVSGSAGTRQQQSHASQKSMHWRNTYGVDLTDVPIMLQRVA